MFKIEQLDESTSFMDQLKETTGPIVLINTFVVTEGTVEQVIQAWHDDAGPPEPLRSVTTRSDGKLFHFSSTPSGHRTSTLCTSAFCPNPKWTRTSLALR